MNFSRMKILEPDLGRLETSAAFAGRHQADWPSTWSALFEPLSKLAGRGAGRDELQTAEAYESAHTALYRAWRGLPAHGNETPITPVGLIWSDVGAVCGGVLQHV